VTEVKIKIIFFLSPEEKKNIKFFYKEQKNFKRKILIFSKESFHEKQKNYKI